MDGDLLFALTTLGLAAAVLVRIAHQVTHSRKEWRPMVGAVTTAFALGRSGRTAEGYELLRGALHAARDRRDLAREPWADDFVRALQQALDRYVARYGAC
jgi:hypothetical protein